MPTAAKKRRIAPSGGGDLARIAGALEELAAALARLSGTKTHGMAPRHAHEAWQPSGSTVTASHASHHVHSGGVVPATRASEAAKK